MNTLPEETIAQQEAEMQPCPKCGRPVHPENTGFHVCQLRLPVENVEPHKLRHGEFCVWEGSWYARSPNGLLADLRAHSVTIDSGGLVTVSPSIEVKAGDLGYYHGFLENGRWRAA